MTWHDEQEREHVKLVAAAEHYDGAPVGVFAPQEAKRTDAQKHTDTALDNADASAVDASVAFGESLEWAASVGVEIPSRVRGVVTILGQWQKHLEDERKRRG